MALYSFFMQFRGGTYISQTTATNLNQAVEIWAKTLEVDGIQYLGEKSKQYLIDNLDVFFEYLGNIDTVINIWITDFSFKTGIATIHIFKTDTTPEPIE